MAYNGYYKINGTDVCDIFYPVGSVYLSMDSTSPQDLYGGTWSQIGSGYALWTASSGAGGTISAGVPNIYGTITTANDSCFVVEVTNGCIRGYTTSAKNHTYTGSGYTSRIMHFDASRSNSIYGNSSTVQPPAIKIYAWKRTA